MIAKKGFAPVAMAAVWLVLFGLFRGLQGLFHASGPDSAEGVAAWVLGLSYLAIAGFIIRSRKL